MGIYCKEFLAVCNIWSFHWEQKGIREFTLKLPSQIQDDIIGDIIVNNPLYYLQMTLMLEQQIGGEEIFLCLQALKIHSPLLNLSQIISVLWIQ